MAHFAKLLALWSFSAPLAISIGGFSPVTVNQAVAQTSPALVSQECRPPAFRGTGDPEVFSFGMSYAGALSRESNVSEDGRYYIALPIYGHENEQVIFTATSEEFAPTILLIRNGVEQTIIAQDNNQDNDSNATIEVTFSASDNYVIILSSNEVEKTGSYTLSFQGARYALLKEGVRFYEISLRLAERGNFKDAITAIQRTIEIYTEAWGNCRDQSVAMVSYLESLQQQLADVEPDQSEKAELQATLDQLIQAESETDDIKEKIDLLRQIIEIYRRIPPEDSLELVGTLLTLAQYVFFAEMLTVDGEQRFNYRDPIPLHQEAIDIIESQDWPDKENGRLAMFSEIIGRFIKEGLADLPRAEGWFLRAIEYQTQSDEAFEDDFFSESISAVGFLSEIYLDQNRYDELIKIYQKILNHNLNVVTEPVELAESHEDLARFYRAIGRPDQAENHYEEALKIHQENPVEDSDFSQYNIANSLHSLALTIQDQGRYSEAQAKLEEVVSLARKLPERFDDFLPNALNSLAEIYRIRSSNDSAEELYVQALNILKKNVNDNGEYQDKEMAAVVLYNLGNYYVQQDRHDEAEPLLEEAIALFEAELKDNENTFSITILPEKFYISALNSLAGLRFLEGEHQQAIDLYTKATNFFVVRELSTHPLLGLVLRNIASSHLDSGEMQLAVQNALLSADIFEINLDHILSSGSESERQAYINTLAENTNFNILLHLKTPQDMQQATELALTTILRRKGRILDAGSETLQWLRRQELDNPQVGKLLDQLINVRRNLSNALSGSSNSLSGNPSRASVNELLQQEQAIEAQLSDLSASFRIQNEPVKVAAVQEQIPVDAVLLEFFRYYQGGTTRYIVYLLDNEGNIRWQELGEARTIDQKVQEFQEKLRCGDLYARPCYDIDEVKQAARELDDLTMAKIRPLLGDSQHLLLSPDGQLNLIPFAALVDETNRYLAETYTITYLSSGRDLLKFNLEDPNRRPKQGPVIFANPDYANPGDATPAEIATAPSADTDTALRGADTRSVDFSDLRFGPLPGTEQEKAAIAPLLPNVTTLDGIQATENNLKQLEAPSILHIATHGFFLPDVEFVAPPSNDQSSLGSRATILVERPTPDTISPSNLENPLLRSGLALAGFNPRRSGEEDGVLTALEASGLNLYGTEMVVLSACETALGEVAYGEGVYGLRRAFVIAGAESLLMSLWKVSDDGTADLMERYYQRLSEGAGRSEALHEVQLELMQDPAYEHPYYWASFIFSGDWGPLESL